MSAVCLCVSGHADVSKRLEMPCQQGVRGAAHHTWFILQCCLVRLSLRLSKARVLCSGKFAAWTWQTACVSLYGDQLIYPCSMVLDDGCSSTHIYHCDISPMGYSLGMLTHTHRGMYLTPGGGYVCCEYITNWNAPSST